MPGGDTSQGGSDGSAVTTVTSDKALGESRWAFLGVAALGGAAL